MAMPEEATTRVVPVLRNWARSKFVRKVVKYTLAALSVAQRLQFSVDLLLYLLLYTPLDIRSTLVDPCDFSEVSTGR